MVISFLLVINFLLTGYKFPKLPTGCKLPKCYFPSRFKLKKKLKKSRSQKEILKSTHLSVTVPLGNHKKVNNFPWCLDYPGLSKENLLFVFKHYKHKENNFKLRKRILSNLKEYVLGITLDLKRSMSLTWIITSLFCKTSW